MTPSLQQLARGIAAGERPALSRALSLAERDPETAAILVNSLADRLGRAHVVGITGPPGAGKSTLVGALARQLLSGGKRIAILAVDPTSPVSGGALLGDRFRIGDAGDDARCFVRSTASRGSLGGLTGAARPMVQLMDAAGYDLVLVETVGTGQSEFDVAQLADSLLVVFPPGLGDELQAIKAGILELADLLVVTKGDTPAAPLARQALQRVVPMWRRSPPIHAVSSLTGEGVAALADAVLDRSRQVCGRDRTSPTPEPPPSLARVVDDFRRELARSLSFLAQADLAVSLPGPTGGNGDARLEIEIGLGKDGDPFSLGAAVGALALLAGNAGLGCAVERVGNGVRVVLSRR